MAQYLQPRRSNVVEDFLGGFQGALGAAKTLQTMRESAEELDIKKRQIQKEEAAQKNLEEYRLQQTIQDRMKTVTDLINAKQEKVAETFFNTDPILQKHLGPNVGGRITFDEKEQVFKGDNGFVARYRRNPPAGESQFEVLSEAAKSLSPKEQLQAEAIQAMKRGKIIPGFKTLEEQREYALGYKPVDPLLEFRKEEIESRIGERKTRIERYRQIIELSKDPRSTTGQLSAAFNSLEMAIPRDLNEETLINEARRNILRSLAARERSSKTLAPAGKEKYPPGWELVK